jgi:signal recognition particle receptor subunit beta
MSDHTHTGHQRLRSQLDTFLPITKGIVYLVDSVESRSQLTQNAQYARPTHVNGIWLALSFQLIVCVCRFLFDLFTNKTVNRRRTPILIACNKSEMVTAKRKEFIQSELEKELYVCT